MSGKTVVFFPEGAFGPTNNCVGIGEVLRAHGHRVVFIIEESFAGTLEARGFEERLMRLGPPPEEPEVPGQFWKDFIRDTAPVFRKPTIDQLESFIQPTWQALVDGARYVDPRLEEIIAELEPDVIVEDNVVAFPALPPAACRGCGSSPATRWRCVILTIPPVFSGCPVDDRSQWGAFREEYRPHPSGDMAGASTSSSRARRAAAARARVHARVALAEPVPVPARGRLHRARRPLARRWHRLDSCVRSSDAAFELPDALRDGDGALVYLSLGSLGSADVALMKRLVEVLGTHAAPLHRLQGPAARRVSSWPATCGARSSCPSRRSCRWSTW